MRKFAFSLLLVMLCSPLVLFANDLFTIAETGTVAQVKQAIEAGADVNAREYGYTPLMLAAGGNENPAVCVVLIEAGAAM